jgi:hypothetical protein
MPTARVGVAEALDAVMLGLFAARQRTNDE